VTYEQVRQMWFDGLLSLGELIYWLRKLNAKPDPEIRKEIEARIPWDDTGLDDS
jgi:hypothetical protein